VIPSEGSARDRIVTPTLGEIYAAQGQYAKAIGVFELLSKKDPTNRHFREKIDYLKKRLQETQNAG
jgi:cytochrome c-type biogenesis protein CcmH/NrfG